MLTPSNGTTPCSPSTSCNPAANAAVVRADRGFAAIVVGEYERAFAGGQLQQLLPLLHQYGVQLWLPETGGLLDPANPAHQALLMLLGHQSQREVLRSRFRTMAAMRVQARDQGRHLGGRPPYGYRLVDAGPHPNVVALSTRVLLSLALGPTGSRLMVSAMGDQEYGVEATDDTGQEVALARLQLWVSAARFFSPGGANR